MKNDIRRPNRSFERGEGTAKFVVYLLILAIGGYLAVQNVPIYFAMQNLKHELAEKARGAGTMSVPVDKVKKDVEAITSQYGVDPDDVTVTKRGKSLTIKLDTRKQLNFIVTDYEWHVKQETTGTAY